MYSFEVRKQCMIGIIYTVYETDYNAGYLCHSILKDLGIGLNMEGHKN